ncbi:hypothetical protein GPALN_014571 [Globodera pallida]|nr:hypothetical protein GPALN_014571 [Globodera pallida]
MAYFLGVFCVVLLPLFLTLLQLVGVASSTEGFSSSTSRSSSKAPTHPPLKKALRMFRVKPEDLLAMSKEMPFFDSKAQKLVVGHGEKMEQLQHRVSRLEQKLVVTKQSQFAPMSSTEQFYIKHMFVIVGVLMCILVLLLLANLFWLLKRFASSVNGKKRVRLESIDNEETI